MSDKIKIDPEKFAYEAMKAYQINPQDSTERTAKNQLYLYLEAYFLVEKFNKLEANNFKLFNKQEKLKIFQAINKASQDQ